jgi:rSAM/selenodomain-associated transferase 2
MTAPVRISVVVPALNEEREIGPTLASLAPQRPAEVLVVDGGSTDRTVEVARAAGAKVTASARGRAIQMNAGAAVATGEVLLFLHADCRLDPGGLNAVAAAFARAGSDAIVGGWFNQRYDRPEMVYRLLAAGANLRAGRLRLPYGDQAIFVRADVFRRLGGFPLLPIMEDVAFARALRRAGRTVMLRATVRPSARRFEQVGPWRMQWRFWSFSLRAAAGVPLERLAAEYADVR